MSFKKVISGFTIIATLSVFSCSVDFLWTEFTTHIIAKSDACSAEQHCLDDCVVCEVSEQVLAQYKALNSDREDFEVVSVTDLHDYSGDGFAYAHSPPAAKLILEHYFIPKLPESSYALAHNNTRTVILII